MSLVTELSELVGDLFEEQGLDRSFGAVAVAQRPDLAQFQCNGAMASAKVAKRPPFEIAEAIATRANDDPRIAHADVAKPGFVNLTVTDDHLAASLAAATDDAFGVAAPTEPKQVVVDYGGPNVAKALHVGHLRTALIGESLKRIFRTAGHTVTGDIHLGDWGLPMGQLAAAIADAQPDLPYFDPDRSDGFPEASPVTVTDLEKLYPEASARFKQDEAFQTEARAATVAIQNGQPGYRALWQQMRQVSVDDMRAIYSQLGVDFELWHGESSVADRIPGVLDRFADQGLSRESDGALVVDVAEESDKAEIPPLMLLNSRGGATYHLTDVATIEQRVEELDADEIIYCVDLRQSQHFEQVFRAARKAGIAPDSLVLFFAGNGTVNGPDGKPFKTRDGGLPRLGDLLVDVQQLATTRMAENDLATEFPDEERAELARKLGLAALTFGELSNFRGSSYNFDLDKFTLLQGKTGPYLQYVAVRMGSILSRLADDGVAAAQPTHEGQLQAPQVGEERTLMLELLRWPEVIERAVETYSPTVIAEYAYELAGTFNRFYEACHIRSENDPHRQASMTELVKTTRSLLAVALDLLLIEIPDRM